MSASGTHDEYGERSAFDAAEHASEEGDVRLAENFRAMAAMIEGESGERSSDNLRPLELILTQALTLLQLYMDKAAGKPGASLSGFHRVR